MTIAVGTRVKLKHHFREGVVVLLSKATSSDGTSFEVARVDYGPDHGAWWETMKELEVVDNEAP